ncbi:transcription termination factor 2 isoform X2 [Aricia agestis]|uniref:transcription termination factor 2 isoform X2 n=1 Tax=Aricia agestis TaxID=91739 RepID=UPI001C20A3F5|nr:transcription termination factor 2 isoform X2 [Aricia agestis]
MESSFFEYRDDTIDGSGDNSEIIDDSYLDESFAPKKTPAKKNNTAYIPESDDDISGEDSAEEQKELPKSKCQRSNVNKPLVLSGSDDDNEKRHSMRRHGNFTTEKIVTSSSEEEGPVSPEMVPRRRPMTKPRRSTEESFIGRKNKKRIMLIESDTDNSILIEHNKNRKLKCLQDTPIKIDSGTNMLKDIKNMSIESDLSQSTDEEISYIQSDNTNDGDNDSHVDKNKKQEKDKIGNVTKDKVENPEVTEKHEVTDDECTDNVNRSSDENHIDVTDEEHDEEEEMVMCRATRMSIMGIIPKENESDDSDYIQSEASGRTSHGGSETSLPEVTLKSPEKVIKDIRRSTEKQISVTDGEHEENAKAMSNAIRLSIMGVVPKDSDFIQSEALGCPLHGTSETDLPEVSLKSPERLLDDSNSSRISCSPFNSPFRDVTNTEPESEKPEDVCDLTHFDSPELKGPNKENNSNSNKKQLENDVYDLTRSDTYDIQSKVKSRLSKVSNVRNLSEEVIDDDIKIIDQKPEVIALSSDDEEDIQIKKSNNPKKSPNPKKLVKDEPVKQDSTIKQYFVPTSYPNQVVYVKKHVRENELNKLNGLKEDLQNIRYLLSNMDVDTLPDGGVKLIERLTELEEQVRAQGDKVANMIVEPDTVTPDVIANDGFGKDIKGLSWEEIQKASNAVQPRMFGKQAMSTHMAEREVILSRLRNLHESLKTRPEEGALAVQPAALRSELMQHQRHALAWLRWRETQSPPGGLLADDMGLGKTLTMISLIASDKEKIQDDDDDDQVNKKLVRGGTLVVCPASLVTQWAAEVSTHCAAHALSVCAHHGAARATQPHRLAPYDVVITTYNILQREAEKNGVLTRVAWRRVILDEAHVVRNHKAATSLAVCGLRARRRWALTGTPLHNKDLDLFALLKFLRCTPFDELPMWKKWIDNKSAGGQERLTTIMQCVMLRRTKLQLQEMGQLACLPDRDTIDKDVTLDKEEMNVYQKVLVFSKTLFAQFLHQRAERQAEAYGVTRPSRNEAYDKMHKKMIALQGAKPVKSHEILVLLLRLRQVCCHCGLIAAMLDDSEDVREDLGSKDLLAELNKLSLEDGDKRKSVGIDGDEEEEGGEGGEGTSVAEAIRSVLSPHNPVFDLLKQSSKIRAVMACLNEHVFSKPGEKAVVVSQWTSVLSLVERELKRENVKCVTLSGAVPVTKRNALVTALNDPNSNTRVMLLSLCAGGVGLNLCGANHLLLLDPHWNPQLEQQAQDRVYRVGQKRPVTIYRFMCLDTVEQSIRQLQRAKLDMADSVLTGARPHASKLTIEDLRMLFNMGPQGT